MQTPRDPRHLMRLTWGFRWQFSEERLQQQPQPPRLAGRRGQPGLETRRHPGGLRGSTAGGTLPPWDVPKLHTESAPVLLIIVSEGEQPVLGLSGFSVSGQIVRSVVPVDGD